MQELAKTPLEIIQAPNTKNAIGLSLCSRAIGSYGHSTMKGKWRGQRRLDQAYLSDLRLFGHVWPYI
jgi:hypothetical protein